MPEEDGTAAELRSSGWEAGAVSGSWGGPQVAMLSGHSRVGWLGHASRMDSGRGVNPG